MSLAFWLHQKGCDHKKLAIRETNLNTPTISTNARRREVICFTCGKVVVPEWDFDVLEEILGGAK